MKKKVFIIHTSLVSMQDLKDLFAEIAPEAELYNIMDDSFLPEVRANGGVTPNVVKRMTAYFQMAEAAGADLIFNQCSSVGEAADVAAATVTVPVVKVDEAMARMALSFGSKVSMIATLPTTLDPSVRLVERTAAALGKEVTVKRCLVDGAFDVLFYEKNAQKHNEMVIEAINAEAETDADVILLAQGSMMHLLPLVKDSKVPVLCSPRLGVMHAKEVLDTL